MSGMNGSPVPGGCWYYPLCSKCKDYDPLLDICKRFQQARLEQALKGAKV